MSVIHEVQTSRFDITECQLSLLLQVD